MIFQQTLLASDPESAVGAQIQIQIQMLLLRAPRCLRIEHCAGVTDPATDLA